MEQLRSIGKVAALFAVASLLHEFTSGNNVVDAVINDWKVITNAAIGGALAFFAGQVGLGRGDDPTSVSLRGILKSGLPGESKK